MFRPHCKSAFFPKRRPLALAVMVNVQALAATPKDELVQQVVRMKNFIKNEKVRQHTGRVARLTADSVLTVAGGVAAGVLSVKMPKVMGIDTDVALGSLCVFGALLDMADGYDSELNALGSGLLAAAAARETATHLLTKKTG
jgi:uncharacterized protein with ACT and thioredoxin-like domain